MQQGGCENFCVRLFYYIIDTGYFLGYPLYKGVAMNKRIICSLIFPVILTIISGSECRAETAEAAEIQEYGFAVDKCREQYFKEDTCQNLKNSDCSAEKHKMNENLQNCYMKVLTGVWREYYGLTPEEADKYSKTVLRSIKDANEYVLQGMSCKNIPECLEKENFDDTTFLLQEYSYRTVLFLYGTENEKSLAEIYLADLQDEEQYDVTLENPYTTVSVCKTDFVQCQNYEESSCLAKNQDIIEQQKKCYENEMTKSVIRFYGRTEEQARIFIQKLWQEIYKRNSFIFGESLYKNKSTDEIKKFYASAVSLVDFLYIKKAVVTAGMKCYSDK